MRKNNRWILLSAFVGVLVTFTSQSQIKKNQQQKEAFQEMSDPTADTLSDWTAIPKGLHASFASIDKRYPKSVAPTLSIQKKAKISGWKGEKLSAQILLWTTQNLESVKVNFTDLRSSKGDIISKTNAKARFVRYVMTDEFGNGCGSRKAGDFPASLSADMIDNVQTLSLEKNKTRPVWLTIQIPSTAKAGTYTTQVQILRHNTKTETLNLEVEVINQTLPPPSKWAFHLDQWQHPSAIARVQNVPIWSDQHFEAMKPVMQMLADAGQKVITATLNKDPWNVQTYDPYEEMIIWNKKADGTWSYDYAVFDRWVKFMMDFGIKKSINCYSIIPWNNEIHYRDLASGKLINVKAVPGSPIFNELWGNFFTDFKKHLKQKGWLTITNIAMDERDQKSMDAAFKLIDSIAPELGISFADNKKTYQRYPKSKDIAVSATDPILHEDIVTRRQNGLNTTFYTYCATKFPNQFTFSDPAESTYLGWYALAKDFDGFLRWAFNSWVENPMQDSRFRKWPAGDTYIVYPNGRSSIRYERMVEGIQDFEKVKILKKKLLAKNDKQSLEKLQKAINKLNKNQRTENWNTDLNEAKQILNTLSKL